MLLAIICKMNFDPQFYGFWCEWQQNVIMKSLGGIICNDYRELQSYTKFGKYLNINWRVSLYIWKEYSTCFAICCFYCCSSFSSLSFLPPSSSFVFIPLPLLFPLPPVSSATSQLYSSLPFTLSSLLTFFPHHYLHHYLYFEYFKSQRCTPIISIRIIFGCI